MQSWIHLAGVVDTFGWPENTTSSEKMRPEVGSIRHPKVSSAVIKTGAVFVCMQWCGWLPGYPVAELKEISNGMDRPVGYTIKRQACRIAESKWSRLVRVVQSPGCSMRNVQRRQGSCRGPREAISGLDEPVKSEANGARFPSHYRKISVRRRRSQDCRCW